MTDSNAKQREYYKKNKESMLARVKGVSGNDN